MHTGRRVICVRAHSVGVVCVHTRRRVACVHAHANSVLAVVRAVIAFAAGGELAWKDEHGGVKTPVVP